MACCGRGRALQVLLGGPPVGQLRQLVESGRGGRRGVEACETEVQDEPDEAGEREGDEKQP